MAKILYFSTHEPLEHDDIRLFTEMGHTIFSIGKFCPANEDNAGVYRNDIEYDNDVLELVELYRSEGCHCKFMDMPSLVLTEKFLNIFDYVIAVQAIQFIIEYWPILRGPTVIWRTVGQAIEHYDAPLAPLRERGLKIVRWSARERCAPTYIGHDAIIRAYKDPKEYCGWMGSDQEIITFSNEYRQRYPIEQMMFERMCHDVPYSIGGSGNSDLKNSIGVLSLADMKAKMRRSRAYFYGHGCTIPYTLNFIEAWMTGMPIVAAGRNVEIVNIDMKYNEINDFVTNGKDGFLFKSEVEANQLCHNLLRDKELAETVGTAAREQAVRIFGIDRAMADWQSFFDACDGRAQRAEKAMKEPKSELVRGKLCENKVLLQYKDWGLYNNPEVNERKAELPLAFWFLERHLHDVIEIGEVTPFYAEPKHSVFDSVPEKSATYKVDAMYLDYRDKNVLSISTVEHVGSGDYGLPVRPHDAIRMLSKMITQAKSWLITFSVGHNLLLERDLIDRGIEFLLIERTSENTWQQVDHKNLSLYRYNSPMPHGNAIIVVTNMTNTEFVFTGYA